MGIKGWQPFGETAPGIPASLLHAFGWPGLGGRGAKGREPAYKPDSVFVWRFIYAANPEGRRAASSPPYLALLPAGFARPPGYPERR